MGRIPLVTSQINARAGRTNDTFINSFANPNTFGAGVGEALQNVAGAIGRATDDFAALHERKQNETVANKVAQSDTTRLELETRNEVGPDGAGLQERTLQRFDEYVEQQAASIDDPRARQAYRERMQQLRPGVSSRSTQAEFTLSAEHSKAEAEASLLTLENKIMADSSSYDEFVKQGEAVLDTRSPNAAIRESMKTTWRQSAARARFVGMLDAAQTTEDLDRIAAELAGPQGEDRDRQGLGRDWTKELDPKSYETLVNQIGAARKSIATQADANARAALDTLETRVKDMNTLIPRDELKAVADVVKLSQNPITVSRMARITRDQEIIAEQRKLPPTEQRAIINGASGGPDTMHPGLPPRVSNAVNAATGKFRVSGSYLALTAQREYGSNFKRKSANVDPKYTPQGAASHVDLRNVRPDVVEAATVAGQLFGETLQITSGYRSPEKQKRLRYAKGKDPNRASIAKDSHHSHGNGLDINTAGMSAAKRAQLAGALVDAGFTGIGEYGTHIHADFRAAVPASFGDREGRTWGGWTYLSPEVAAALKERGFGPSVDAKALKRAAPVQYAEDIDYGRGTDIKDANGNPTSSVVGVGQFTSGTWLELMKDGQTASRMGVDVSNMSDEQILELRKDPDLSIMGMAALAEKNTVVLERALGRTVDDAELYMAHFLGAGGAVSLLRAKEAQPNQSAAELLPQAASANKNVFYSKGGKAYTVEQLYNNIANSFTASPSRVAYDDVQTRKQILSNTEKQLKDDPMQYASDVGTHTVPEFNVDNMNAYGTSVKSVADYYQLPISDMKVLGPDQEAVIKKYIDEGSADEVLKVMTAFQGMGEDVARAALKQIGEKDPVYAYAGSLNLERGQDGVAGDIIRGQKRLSENPAVKTDLGADDGAINQAFRLATGNALNEASPRARQVIQDAALAHYVETVVARGKGNGAFDQDAYEASVQAVLGGSAESASVGEVNGEITVLPPGVSAEKLETAMQNMSLDDWAEMSPQGVPPRYIDGTPIQPDDLADEAKLRAIGGGEYKIQLDDGSFAITGEKNGGRYEAYIFAPDAERIDKLQAAPNAPAAPDYFAPEQLGDPLGLMQNPMGQFDDNGRWLGR